MTQNYGEYLDYANQMATPEIYDYKVKKTTLLPWKHTLLLKSKHLDDDAVLYYAKEDIAKGWNADNT